MLGTSARRVTIGGCLLVLAVVAPHAGVLCAPPVTSAYGVALTAAPGETPVTLYAEEHGRGRPLLLLHGLGESTFTWRNIAPRLAQSHRVIALDLKGFGRSDKPFDQAYSAVDQARLIAAFIRKRRLTGIALVGHSFGGNVALMTTLELNRTEPGRIRSLVLIGAPALPRSDSAPLDFVMAPAVPEVIVTPLPPEALARILLEQARGGATDIPDEDIKGYAAPYYELAAKHAFLATARSIVSDTGDALVRRYRTIRQPALVVWCRDDSIVPLRTGRRLARTLRNARLTVMKGCHHLPQDERPAALLARLQPFLAR